MMKFLTTELNNSSVDGTVATAIVKYSTILKKRKVENGQHTNINLSSSAVEKVELLKECGVTISKNPSVMGETVKSVLNGKKN